jgi:hypothetical protein
MSFPDYLFLLFRRFFVLSRKYCPQIMSWSPQGMRVLRQCTVPRGEVLFVTIQRENILLSSKEINKAVTMLSKLPDVCSYVMNYYVTLSLTNGKSSVHLYALYSPRTALRTFTPRRVQLLIYINTYPRNVDMQPTSTRCHHPDIESTAQLNYLKCSASSNYYNIGD